MRRAFAAVMFAGVTVMGASIQAAPGAGEESAAIAPATVAVQRVNVSFPGLRDEAAMVLIGTALIGLAAAVRRAA